MNKNLRYYSTQQHHKWMDILSLAEFSYNNAKHSTTGVSPFYDNLGIYPRMDFPQGHIGRNEAAGKFVIRLRNIKEKLKKAIALAVELEDN